MNDPIYWMMVGEKLKPCRLEPRDATLIGDISALAAGQEDPAVRDHVARLRERVCELVVESGRYVEIELENVARKAL